MEKKIIINGIIKLQTGLHIGGDSSYSSIGMIDNIVVKDKMTKLPIIPGSSLKGKMRSLLSRAKNGKAVNHKDDGEEILRLFGSSEKGNVKKSRLQFSDCMYLTRDEIVDVTAPYEIKYENTIDRERVVSNPRSIERVVRGSKFSFNLTYCVDNEMDKKQDMLNIIQALKLLQLDYLGGGGSRGNGRILFEDFEIKVANDNLEVTVDETLTKQFREVVEYGKLCYQI